jgi:hypothetical protein
MDVGFYIHPIFILIWSGSVDMAKVLCQVCREKSEKSTMIVEEKVAQEGNKKGEVKRKYYHPGECYEKFLKDKEFKEKENMELDSLYSVIKEIHSMDIVTSTFFGSYLQPVRNGNFKLGRKTIKRKEGIPYPIIEKAYKLAKPNILYAKNNKMFDSAINELKYCFAIVIDKLPMAIKQLKMEKRKEEIREEALQVEQEEEREIVYKKKQNNNDDFSDLLDD